MLQVAEVSSERATLRVFLPFILIGYSKIHTQKGLGVDSSLLPSVLVLYLTYFILVNYHHKPN
jgi:hypothetical protein